METIYNNIPETFFGIAFSLGVLVMCVCLLTGLFLGLGFIHLYWWELKIKQKATIAELKYFVDHLDEIKGYIGEECSDSNSEN